MTCTHHWTVTSECPMCLRAEVEALRVALKVIRTWAGHDLDYRSGALDPEHVLKLADKTLAEGTRPIK